MKTPHIVGLSILLLTIGVGAGTATHSTSRFVFHTSATATGVGILWKCDTQTGDAWWVMPGMETTPNANVWHPVLTPTNP